MILFWIHFIKIPQSLGSMDHKSSSITKAEYMKMVVLFSIMWFPGGLTTGFLVWVLAKNAVKGQTVGRALLIISELGIPLCSSALNSPSIAGLRERLNMNIEPMLHCEIEESDFWLVKTSEIYRLSPIILRVINHNIKMIL